MRAVLLAVRDRDGLGVRINAVLDEFRNRLQGIALRQRDVPDRIPVIPNTQLAAVFAFHFHTSSGASGRNVFGIENEGSALVAGQPAELKRAGAPRSIGRAAQRLRHRFAQSSGMHQWPIAVWRR
jgi:hypothetical protein